MKLYLSSYRIPTPRDLIDLIGKEKKDIKVALIPNAKDYYAERPRSLKIHDVVKDFEEIGLNDIEIVDLREYKDPRKLFEILKDYHLIWVAGGNTFILRHEMEKSGFDEAIRKLLAKGIVYGGESAGALVAGNSLRGVEFADDPEFAEKVISKGLNLTPHFVLPHIDSADFGSAIEQAKDAHKHDSSMILLKDTQALVINGEKEKVVSK